MSCVCVSTEVEVVRPKQKRLGPARSLQGAELWRAARRRWLAGGVLAALAAAAVWPRAAAPGGPLRAERLVQLPLCATYWLAGRRAQGGARPSLRALALGCAHAHAVAPALAAAAALAFRGAGLHPRLLSGLVVSSVGGPCAWLSLAAVAASGPEAGAAPALLAASHAASLLAAPLSMLVICGRATVPALGGELSTALGAVAPFALGALVPARAASAGSALACRVCALLVLYVECCTRFAAAEGSLLVQDVLATMLLVVGYVCGSAGVCWAYARCGLLSRAEARLLALAAVPKCLDAGWESSTACSPAGLSLLPAAFLAPAQALLLAALAEPEPDDPGAGALPH